MSNVTKMVKIERALISVYDKKWIDSFAKTLSRFGVEILATSNTAKFIKSNGINTQEISEYTGFPELMEGLVKTLHPEIHAGILAERENKNHINELAKYNIKKIDMVVVNLYPFEERPSKENIDIGGVTLIRSASKNYENVAVLIDSEDYLPIIKELQDNNGCLSTATLKMLAVKALGYIANYDTIIYNTLNKFLVNDEFPSIFVKSFKRLQKLRYGENPHQKSAFYIEPTAHLPSVATAKKLHGKELSFNNILDADSALQIVREFTNPASAIVKHTNPCGVAVRESIEDALRHAYYSDTESAYGCVIALNMPCNIECAKLISKWFVELVIAPSFQSSALKLLMKKKNIRLLETGRLKPIPDGIDFKKIFQGLLVQTDNYPYVTDNSLSVVSKRKPTKREIQDMLFAYKVNKHLKSNSIVIARNQTTLGMGAGQTSRIFATKIAIMKAKNTRGTVMSSDAFFPFRDSVDEAAKSHISAIIQPGGSIRDAEVIKSADEHNIAMVFTGVRLFKH